MKGSGLPDDVSLCCEALDKAAQFTQFIQQRFLAKPILKEDASPVTRNHTHPFTRFLSLSLFI